jgi:putative lipoic acid-binding regulatory protein
VNGKNKNSGYDLNQKPKITYPCEWSYHLIGRDENAICEATLNALNGKKHTLAPSRKSSKGGFVSMKLSVIVLDENERLAFFDSLRSHKAILHIL